jgi:hypothetical protein
MNTATTTLSEQETGWVAEAANRLRLIQADTANSTPDQRREFLTEEIASRLKNVPPANRKRHLNALLARFPVAGANLAGAPSAVPAVAPAAPPPPETFEQLLERFLASAAEQPEAKRMEVAKRLSEAGLAWIDNNAVVLELTEDLRQNLGLGPEQQPRLRNMVQLCTQLVQMVQRLDQAGLATMKDFSPKSPLLKRPQDFRAAIAQYLAGESDSAEPQLRAVSGLLGALLAANMGGVKDFGKHYHSRFSPNAIEDVVVGAGGGGFFGKSKTERCWDQFVKLSEEFATPDLVVRRVKECMAAFVEKNVVVGR